MEVSTTGLRERKHLQTRSRLEEAAITLVTKDGLDRTTIDAISEAANVSPRTFFNYFDSKEDAVLGIHLTSQSNGNENHPVDFKPVDDLVGSVVDLIISIMNPSKDSHRLKQKRMSLVRQHPALMEKQIGRVTQLSDTLNAKVKDMLLIKYPNIDPIQAAESSGVIVMTCVGGVKIAVKEWLSQGANELTDEVKQQAIKIINNATKVL